MRWECGECGTLIERHRPAVVCPECGTAQTPFVPTDEEALATDVGDLRAVWFQLGMQSDVMPAASGADRFRAGR